MHGEPEIQIRPLTFADFLSVCTLMQALHTNHIALRPDLYRAVDPVLSAEEFCEYLHHDMAYGAVSSGELCALSLFRTLQIDAPEQVPRRIFRLDALVVREEERHRGIARALLQKGKELAAKGEYTSFELQVNAANETAKKLYAACGFSEKSINMEYIL